MYTSDATRNKLNILRRIMVLSAVVVLVAAVAAIVIGALHPDDPAQPPQTTWDWVAVMMFVLAGFTLWISAMIHAWTALREYGGVRILVLFLLFGGNVLAGLLYLVFYAAREHEGPRVAGTTG